MNLVNRRQFLQGGGVSLLRASLPLPLGQLFDEDGKRIAVDITDSDYQILGPNGFANTILDQTVDSISLRAYDLICETEELYDRLEPSGGVAFLYEKVNFFDDGVDTGEFIAGLHEFDGSNLHPGIHKVVKHSAMVDRNGIATILKCKGRGIAYYVKDRDGTVLDDLGESDCGQFEVLAHFDKYLRRRSPYARRDGSVGWKILIPPRWRAEGGGALALPPPRP